MSKRAVWLVALAALCLPSQGVAQVTIPDTPAGRPFADWLAAYNSGDRAKLAMFREKYERGWAVDETAEWRSATGGFDLLEIQSSEPNRIVALLKERASDFAMGIEVSVTGNGIGPNLSMLLTLSSLTGKHAVPRLSLAAALRALRKRADQLASEDRFAGTILVARKNQVLMHDAWGPADRVTAAPVTKSSRFRLGSMNKMFTSIAILQLVAARKITLDSTLDTYLADYPNKELASLVTVRQLLSHTGGAGDIFGPEFDTNRLMLRTHADYLRLYGARGPEFSPGSQDSYSNYGFILLGLVIEKVTGRSYYDHVDEQIYRPLGMMATGSEPESARVANRVFGYTKKSGAWISNNETLPWRGTAAGGGYSTTGDLLRFANALRTNRLVPQDLLVLATSPQDHSKNYGFGFVLYGEGQGRGFGHSGGAPGMNAALRVIPDPGYTIVVLSNLDPNTADILAEFVSLRLPLEEKRP